MDSRAHTIQQLIDAGLLIDELFDDPDERLDWLDEAYDEILEDELWTPGVYLSSSRKFIAESGIDVLSDTDDNSAFQEFGISIDLDGWSNIEDLFAAAGGGPVSSDQIITYVNLNGHHAVIQHPTIPQQIEVPVRPGSSDRHEMLFDHLAVADLLQRVFAGRTGDRRWYFADIDSEPKAFFLITDAQAQLLVDLGVVFAFADPDRLAGSIEPYVHGLGPR